MDALRGPFPTRAPRNDSEVPDGSLPPEVDHHPRAIQSPSAPPPAVTQVRRTAAANSANSDASSRASTRRRRGLRLLQRGNPQPAIDPDGEIAPPARNYDCAHYDTCLDLAAALDWRSFTCKGCCGEYDQQLLWRAQHVLRKNPALAKILSLPKPLVNDGAEETAEGAQAGGSLPVACPTGDDPAEDS